VLLSIIIPVYNGENFIKNILTILVSQNLKDMEVLIINDGSIDNTEHIVKEIIKNNKNILLISLKKNSGVSIARNTGIDKSNGKYIYFLDMDDSIPFGTLDFYRDILTQKQADVYVFGFEQKKNGKSIIYSNKYLNNQYFDSISFYKYLFCTNIYTNICTNIFLKDLIIRNNVRFPENKVLGEDTDFWRTALLFAKSIYYNKRNVFIYQIRTDSTMRGYKIYDIKVFNAFYEEILLINNIVKIFPELEKYANYFLTRRFCGNILMYICSLQKERYVGKKLLNIKHLFFKNMIFRFPQTIVFYSFFLFPLRILFYIISNSNVYEK